jgi:hypothetical protein
MREVGVGPEDEGITERKLASEPQTALIRYRSNTPPDDRYSV